MEEPTVSNDAEYPELRKALWPMFLLFLAANLYSIDKAIVAVLAAPITAELQLNDVQMSFLLGLAYALLSGVFGLFLGNLVDRHTRSRILGVAIILWSLSTAAGGLAPDFTSFFIFRALVGLGEAAVAPAAVSLIADMFPPHRRGRAISAYFFGATIGTALSSLIPGFILGSGLQLTLPVFGELSPWRTTFIICGMAGPVLGLLFFTASEPARKGRTNTSSDAVSVSEKLAYVWSLRSVFAPFLTGVCLVYVVFVAITSWTATFVTRHYDMDLPNFAKQWAVVLFVSGLVGYLMGGYTNDSRFGKNAQGRLKIMACLPILSVPCVFAVFAGRFEVALSLLAAITLTVPVMNVSMNAVVQDLLPNEMRGFVYALINAVIALPAGAGGPLLVAYVTQEILQDPDAIGWSILIVCSPCLLIATIAFLMAGRALRDSATEPGIREPKPKSPVSNSWNEEHV